MGKLGGPHHEGEGISKTGNYKGIKLKSHTMKLRARMVERHIWTETNVRGNQFGPRVVHSSMETIFILKQIVEKNSAAMKTLYLGFLDI